MVDFGYGKTIYDHYVFIKRFYNSNFISLFQYMNDMLIVGYDVKRIQSLKEELSKFFTKKDSGPEKHILGMKTTHDRKNEELRLS